MDRLDLAVARAALAELAAWLAQAGPIVEALGRNPRDPRYAPAVERLRQRQALYRRLQAHLAVLEEARAGDQLRFPFACRWARERGVLEVRDCFTGAWLQLTAADLPDHWLAEANRRARDTRARRRTVA